MITINIANTGTTYLDIPISLTSVPQNIPEPELILTERRDRYINAIDDKERSSYLPVHSEVKVILAGNFSFTEADVKAKLKKVTKSRLRLDFFDSPDLSQQNYLFSTYVASEHLTFTKGSTSEITQVEWKCTRDGIQQALYHLRYPASAEYTYAFDTGSRIETSWINGVKGVIHFSDYETGLYAGDWLKMEFWYRNEWNSEYQVVFVGDSAGGNTDNAFYVGMPARPLTTANKTDYEGVVSVLKDYIYMAPAFENAKNGRTYQFTLDKYMGDTGVVPDGVVDYYVTVPKGGNNRMITVEMRPGSGIYRYLSPDIASFNLDGPIHLHYKEL